MINLFLKINPKPYLNGLIIVILISAISLFLSSYYSTPKLLFAILIGMSVSYLSNKKSFEKGIWLASDPVLKLGVSFLGFRLSLENITQLGGASLFLIFILIFITILFGYFFHLFFLKTKTLAF